MKKYIRKIYRKIFRNRFIIPIIDIKPHNIIRYFTFFLKDYFQYKKMDNAEKINFFDFQPQLNDKTQKTHIDSHYFYQSVWTADKVIKNKAEEHFDVGSQKNLIGFLTRITKVKFLDIRPLDVKLDNLENIKADILNLPLKDNSISSLSCLHVAEHIGLGRYGDKLDPLGTKKACAELSRVLSYKGNLYFSLPIGKEKTYFNAHRVHSPKTILDYFKKLKLVEFSGIDDKGNFIKNADIKEFEKYKYGCGLFHFTKDTNQ